MIALHIAFSIVLYSALCRAYVRTKQVLEDPDELRDGVFVLVKQAKVVVGHNPLYACLPVIGGIDREIQDPSFLEWYVDAEKFSFETLDVGTSLRVVHAVTVDVHGIGASFSYGPIDHLVLEDESGVRYRIATVSLGVNTGDEFLLLRDDQVAPPKYYLIGSDNFLSPRLNTGSLYCNRGTPYTGALPSLATDVQ